MPNPIVHAEIRSDDPDATRAFFGGLFGWTFPAGAIPGYTYVDSGVPDALPAGIDTDRRNFSQKFVDATTSDVIARKLHIFRDPRPDVVKASGRALGYMNSANGQAALLHLGHAGRG